MAHAQVPSSLRDALASARQDSTRLDVLLQMAGVALESAPDSAYAYCLRAESIAGSTGRAGDVGEVQGWLAYLDEQQGRVESALRRYRISLAEAERLMDTKGISTVLNNIAAIHSDRGQLDSAMLAHQRSLAIRRERHDTLGIAISLNNIGYLLGEQGRQAEAMEHLSGSLRMFEGIGDRSGIASALHNIAAIYRDQGDLSQALAYFMRELAINDSLQNWYSMASTEDNIGLVLESDGRLDEALVHYQRALRLHEQSSDPRGMGYSLRNIAGIDIKQGRPDSGLVHARQSHALFAYTDDKRGQADALWTQARAHEANAEHAKAMLDGKKALALARELGFPVLVRDVAQLLERLHRARGDWQEALAMKDLYITMRDSVMSQDARRSSMRQQFAYAYEKKEGALKAEQLERDLLARERLQKEENRRNVILFSGIGVLLLALGLWSRLRYTRRSHAAIQKERDVSDGLLHNILPEEVARELKDRGFAEAKHFDQATILFTDFKGFTRLSENVTPAELVQELNTCFKEFDSLMEKYGIEKIKTIGDAYMAAGGLPDPRHGSAADVVRAALEMQDFMKRHKAEREAQGKPYFEMRVGIHTGPVVAGIVGLKKFAYDIWGDTVNIASRMESSGEVGQVNISEATYELVKDVVSSQLPVVSGSDVSRTTDNQQPTTLAFTFTPRGKVQAKGKGEMEMYFVERS